MDSTQAFNLKKIRSFGDILSDTFSYYRVYWRSMAKAFSVYVFAPLIVGVILFGGSFAVLFQNIDSMATSSNPAALAGFGFGFFIGIILILIAVIMIVAVTYQHIRHASDGYIPESLSEFSKGMFGKMFHIFLVSILIAIVLGIGLVITTSIVSSFAGAAAGTISIVLFYIFIFYFLTKLTLYPVALFVEDGSVSNAIMRSWELTNNHFWFTFGVYMIIGLVFSILAMMASIPLLILSGIMAFVFGADLQQDIGILFGVLYASLYFVQTLASSAQFIALGIHYFNLVERKEGGGLASEIDRLGI